MANGSGLAAIEHVVVLMLENRSFDHMLGFLYPGNVTPSGQPFEGLTGTESNPGSNGQPATCQGFIADYAYTLGWQSKESGSWPIVPGTVEGDIMGRL